jgi:acetyl esterase
MTANPHNLSLEPAAVAFAEATSQPPFLYQLPVEEGRKAVDEVQSGDVEKPDIDEEWIDIKGWPTGTVPIRIVKPKGASGTLPVIVYVHGAGWVFGNAHTHDRLVRELAVLAQAAVVFVEYDRSPEAGYPVALEQSYAACEWIVAEGQTHGLDSNRVAVAGDSVGGNMSAALTMLARDRGGVTFAHQVLFYPVTDANFDTGSYDQFEQGYFLTREAMKWFWDQYTTDPEERDLPTVSPRRATKDQLVGLPPALVITAQADVLRDEGEAYAANLRDAGVPVTCARYDGVIHDFVMLNALAFTEPARAAIAQAGAVLKKALHDS